jgi:hypothetical protein
MRVAGRGWRWVFGCFYQQPAARIAERVVASLLPFTWHGPCAELLARLPRRLQPCDFTCKYLRYLQHSTTVTCILHTARESSLRRRAHPHICCIISAAAQCSASYANMSDPPPAKKPAFSLYGDLIAPNGDSSVITSGPVKYDMKPKDLEPEAQKKKNGRVAFYIPPS